MRIAAVALCVMLAGCAQTTVSTDPNPAVGPGSDQVNDWRHQAALDRAACRSAMMQARSTGVSTVAANQQFIECNRKVAADATRANDLDRQRTSPVSAETLRIDIAARQATRQGQTAQALTLYRQIDANGPAIIAEVQRLAPNGTGVSMSNTPADNLRRMDMMALLQELATAQRLIGLSYEHAHDDRTAAAWYEKANSTMATEGGRDGVASVRLGFMYAWGRGVPEDRARALESFGGSGTTTFWNGLLGGQQKGESELAYLLRMNELPRHPEEVTADYVAKIQERDMGAHLEALDEFMDLVNANEEREGVRSRPSPGMGCIGFKKTAIEGMALSAKC